MEQKKQAVLQATDNVGMKWHGVYCWLLVIRGILGILGTAFGLGLLFSFSSLENAGALTLIIPNLLGLACTIVAFLAAFKMKDRTGLRTNRALLVMDGLLAAVLCAVLLGSWNEIPMMEQLKTALAQMQVEYGVTEMDGAPVYNFVAALIGLAAYGLLIAAPIEYYYSRRKKEFIQLAPKHDNAALNSRLLRRPIQRCFVIFAFPTFAAFLLGFVWPFLLGIYRSLSRFSSPVDFKWAGFSNYAKAFQDEGFLHAFRFTSIYAVVSIVLINVLAFALAYALTQKLKGSNLFRTVFFMPNLIGGIVLAYIWKLIFDQILRSLEWEPLLSNSTYGFWGLVILVAWQQIGYIMIIYIAGLQAVPEDMMEAAKIDGANRWQTLWRVTIPNVMPSITICVFLTLTNSFKLFDQNLALTNGSPKIPGTRILETEMLALHIYNTNSINNKWIGTAQAEAFIFFVVVAILAIAQLRLTRQKEVQQ